MSTLFEHAGGEEALHNLEQMFYDSVLLDPLLQPLFGDGQSQHIDHLTMFTAETFGGASGSGAGQGALFTESQDPGANQPSVKGDGR